MAIGLVFVVRINPPYNGALHQFWWANIGLLLFYAVLWVIRDYRKLGPFMIMVAFSLGLLAAQKDLGTALVFYMLFVLMLYAVTERALYLGISLPIFMLIFMLTGNFLAIKYQTIPCA